MIENPKDNTICINPENGKIENWLSVSHCEACDEASMYEYYKSEYEYDEYDYKSPRKGMVSKNFLLKKLIFCQVRTGNSWIIYNFGIFGPRML